MRRFMSYPIHISGSAWDEDFRAFVELISPWLRPDQKEYLIRWSNKLDNVNDIRPQATLHEHHVQMVLAEINGNAVGKAVLRSLPQSVPIWITRYDSLDMQTGAGAITGQMSSDHTKGIRIRYSPDMWLPGPDGRSTPGYRPDETLFHEMVHASRFARFGFDGMNHDPLRDNDDHEEFLAVQVSNVYRSAKKAQKFNHNYTTDKLGSKSEVEYTLWSHEPFLRAIQYFLDDDPIIKAIAQIATDFNPFRDIGRLKHTSSQAAQRLDRSVHGQHGIVPR